MSATATTAQLSALKWLLNRNGDGVFDRFQVLVAGGERAPVMRSTWAHLESLGLVERYLNNRRVRVTDAGKSANLTEIRESA